MLAPYKLIIITIVIVIIIVVTASSYKSTPTCNDCIC